MLTRFPENRLVSYELTTNTKGRSQAKGVAFVGQRPLAKRASGPSKFAVIFTFLFLISLAALVFLGRLPLAILALYFFASVFAFFAYAFDKSAAARDEWRTSESTLHLLALFGGWPGALTAQRLIRHKSAKASFQQVFWATVVLNCGALSWCLSPAGSATLRSLLSIT